MLLVYKPAAKQRFLLSGKRVGLAIHTLNKICGQKVGINEYSNSAEQNALDLI